MPRNYQPKGYTPCQLEIAEWIKLGHTMMREDPQLRCYACTGEGDSRNYYWVKHLIYNGRDLGGGRVLLNGGPILKEGQYRQDVVRNSHVCGLKIEIKGHIYGGKKSKSMALGGG